ncbi:MAG: beta-propeller fold lactonase family protein, partial [Thermoanaerobaculia bacterium]|nr:beta-propeller fold lactonase family protein [Thermoanaerobaculia bacterium]
ITYNLPSLVGGNGAYYLPLTNAYGNAGCVAPPVTGPSLQPPNIDPIPNVTICGDYILPPITGTNLTGNEAYYTGANGTGTQYNAGDVISTPGTYYIYDQNGPVGCDDQVQFTATIGAPPTVNQPADVTVCSGQSVTVNFTGTPAGTVFNWTNDNTGTGLAAGGTGNINFVAANVTVQEISTVTVTPNNGICDGDPVTFTITVNPRPQVDDPPNQTVCGGDQVDVAFTGSGTNPTYNWTNTNTAIGLPASGSGDISFTANNPGNSITGTITVTATENGCPGTPQSFTITVNPTPSVNQPNDVIGCAGQTVTVGFTGSAGAVFNWTNDNTAIGLGASGTGNISFPAALVGNPETATITVTPANAAGTCNGAPVTFTITINPGPTVDNPGNQLACGGQFVSIPLTSPTNPTLNWTNSNTAIGLPASGSGDINFNASNVATPQTGTITVTPVENGCTGPVQTFTITVNPSPFMTQPNDATVCSGDEITVNFTGTPGATFNWTNDNTAIGLDAAGSGNISFFTATGLIFPEVATITVTPNNGFCDGASRTFTITVNPTPVMDVPPNLTVCGLQQVNVAFTSPGNPTYTWTNSNVNIGLPASGSGNLNFTAANVVTNQTGTITVTPSEAGCPGNPVTFTITAVPAPMVNQPGNVTICAGQSILINFSGSNGAVFNWTNSNTAIGLPASGTGNLSLTAAPVTTQQVGTITVTPSNGSCNGAPVSFTITVNPAPAVNPPANVGVCSGAPVAVNFAGTPGATFNWTNNNTAIGLGASGNGNLNFNAATVTATETATIMVTPVLGNCNGTPVAFTITVSPGVSVGNPGDRTVCGGNAVNISFTSTGNPTLNWTNNNTAIGLPASGSGNIGFTAANVATTQTATITVTPSAPGCTGTAQTFTITVNPGASLQALNDIATCSGQPVNVAFNASAGATVNWTNSNPAIGLAASGSGNVMFTAANVTATETATITATPVLGPCSGAPVSFTITINPGVSVDSLNDLSVCAGDSVAAPFSGAGNPVYLWTNDNPAIGLPATGSGDINFVAANVAAPTTATITVIPQSAFGGFAYITNFGSDDVSVINTATNTVVATIPVGDVPRGVSVSPDGTRVYVANEFSDNVSVIDATTNTVIATIPVGNGPFGICVSPDGSRVYVGNIFSGDISVIDATTNTVIATIGGINQPYGITISPDGTKVYVVGFGFGFIAVIDAATNTILTTIPVSTAPQSINISPDGSTIYVTHPFSNLITIIDAASNSVLTTIIVSDGPNAIAISPDGSLVYVVNQNSNTVSVIDASNNTVIATINVGTSPRGISISPDGNFVYVANFIPSNVSVIDANTNTVIATVPVGLGPHAFGNFISGIAGACTGDPQSFTITVNPTPTLSTPNNATACGNQTLNIPFTASPGATVNWTNSNPAIGLPASGSGNLSFMAADVATPQTATITATPVLGSCSGTPVNFTITINPRANGSIAGDLLICAGESTTLTASGGGTYEWAGGETSAAITVSPLVPTSYTVIVTNTFNCASAATVLVDVDEAPAAAIAGNTTLCAGESTTLTASGGGTYNWSNAEVTPAITITPQNTATYTVTVTNAFSCTATSSATVTVNPADTV